LKHKVETAPQCWRHKLEFAHQCWIEFSSHGCVHALTTFSNIEGQNPLYFSNTEGQNPLYSFATARHTSTHVQYYNKLISQGWAKVHILQDSLQMHVPKISTPDGSCRPAWKGIVVFVSGLCEGGAVATFIDDAMCNLCECTFPTRTCNFVVRSGYGRVLPCTRFLCKACG
jgi:hypothetical protein